MTGALLRSLIPLAAACAQTLAPEGLFVGPEAFQELRVRGEYVALVDVRSPEEFEREHIAGAINVPVDQLPLAAFPPDRPVVLYCDGLGCPLSILGARTLRGLGCSQARVLHGGLAAWRKLGLPVTERLAKPKEAPRPRAEPVDSEQLARMLAGDEKPVVLDLRPEHEFRLGHIRGARCLDLGQRPLGAQGLDHGAAVVLYDRRTDRVRSAAEGLLAAGFKKVYVLRESFDVWARKGFPVDYSKPGD